MWSMPSLCWTFRTCKLWGESQSGTEKCFALLEVLLGWRPGVVAGDVGEDDGVVQCGVKLRHFVQLAGVGGEAGVRELHASDGAVLSVPVIHTILDKTFNFSEF